MGFWGSLLGAFGLAKSSMEPAGITTPTPERAGTWASAQTLLSSTPAESLGYGGMMGSDPSYFEGLESSKSGFLGSLWDGFLSVGSQVKKTVSGIYQEAKEIAPEATELYKTIHAIKNPLDATSLFAKEPTRGSPSSPDQLLYTPYPRSSTGAQPAVITTGNGKGLSMPLLLAAGAAALIFLSKKGR